MKKTLQTVTELYLNNGQEIRLFDNKAKRSQKCQKGAIEYEYRITTIHQYLRRPAQTRSISILFYEGDKLIKKLKRNNRHKKTTPSE